MGATLGKRGDRPWRNVTNAELEHAAGNSIFKSHVPLGNVWVLDLECGHQLLYTVRYVKATKDHWHQPKRGWMRRRHAEDALPAPKRVRCPWCPRLK